MKRTQNNDPPPPPPSLNDIQQFRVDFLTWLQKILNNDIDDQINIDIDLQKYLISILNKWDANKFKKPTIFKMKFYEQNINF